MHLTFERNTNSCEDLYWDTVRDRYVLYTHANSAWEEVPIRETGTNSMLGRQKREGGGVFSGRSFETICKQSQLLWKRAPIRETRAYSMEVRKNIGVITLLSWLQFRSLEKNGKPGVGVVDKFDSGREKRVLA